MPSKDVSGLQSLSECFLAAVRGAALAALLHDTPIVTVLKAMEAADYRWKC